MHVSFLCFASYYIPDFGCCPSEVHLSRGKLSSSLNTCSVELPAEGGVVSIILAKWRLALSIQHRSAWELLKNSSSSTITISSECTTR